MNKNHFKLNKYTILILVFGVLLLGCQTEKKPDKPKEKPVNKSTLEVQVINDVLGKLIPKNNLSEKFRGEFPNVYIWEELLVADGKIIQELIALGADKHLEGIDRKKIVSKYMKVEDLKNLPGIEVSYKPPLTTQDLDQHIGAFNFSRIVFYENKHKAIFVYHFEHFNNLNTKQFCAVEVKKNKDNWEITKKTCLENNADALLLISIGYGKWLNKGPTSY